MQKFQDYFQKRLLTVELNHLMIGTVFTCIQAKTKINGKEIVAEGIARKSADDLDEKKANQISGGRAMKALYLKVKYLQEKEFIKEQLRGEGIPKDQKGFLTESLRLLEKRHKSLVHGHVHILMG